MGRSAYTYLHLPLVAGIIVAAVGEELAIAHPLGYASPEAAAENTGGPVLFLAGHQLFTRAVFGVWSAPRLVAIVALLLVAAVGCEGPALLVTRVALVIIAAVSWADARAVHRAAAPVTVG